MKKITAFPLFSIFALFNCLVLLCVMLLSSGSSVRANEGNKDTLYGLYSAARMRMTVDEVRSLVKKLSPQDMKAIPEVLEESGDSTSGTFEVRIVHRGVKGDDFSDIYLTMIFDSEGHTSPLILVHARWEKRMLSGSNLEYSKKKRM